MSLDIRIRSREAAAKPWRSQVRTRVSSWSSPFTVVLGQAGAFDPRVVYAATSRKVGVLTQFFEVIAEAGLKMHGQFGVFFFLMRRLNAMKQNLNCHRNLNQHRHPLGPVVMDDYMTPYRPGKEMKT